MSKTFHSLRLFNFRLIFSATFFTATGMWMQVFAQDWLVLTELTNKDALEVGHITALQFLPQLLLAPWAGVVADRVNRRRLLQTCQLGGGLIAGTLGTLILTGAVQLWHVYVLALALGTLSCFEGPARMAFVSEVVPETSLPNAVGLNAMAFHTARMVGPAAAGFIIDAVGTGWVFLITAVSYSIPALAFALIRSAELIKRTRAEKQRGQVIEGVRYVAQRPEVMMVFLVILVMSGLGLNLQMTSAFMATQVYDRAASEYGIFGTFIAVGSVIGSLLAARRKAPRLRTVIVATGIFGIAETLLALAPNFTVFVLLAVPVGLSSLTVLTSANVYVQLAAEERIRGRVIALYSMIFLGVVPVCAPFIGWVSATFGARWSILVGSLACIAISCIVGVWAFLHRRKQGMRVSLFDSRYRQLT